MASRCATCSTSRTWSTWSSASCSTPAAWDGRTVNVGGGRECSLSLLETTEICRRLTGNEVPIAAGAGDPAGDVPDIPFRLREALRPRRVAAAAQRRAGAGATSTSGSPPTRSGSPPPSKSKPQWGEGSRQRMPVAIITGAGGLIGSEAVDHFVARGLRRRRHRERHAGQLLRPGVLDLARHRAAGRGAPAEFRWENADIRDARGGRADLPRARRQDRAGRPHRRPALPRLGRERPADRLRRQRQRHPQPARGRPRPLPRGALHLLLDQQGLRRHARTACRCRAWRSGSSCPRTTYYKGIDTSMSIDSSTHSLFGVSKAAADLLVQEYGRYFEMPTVCFRGGCLTGPAARRRQAARLPRLPDEVHRHRHARTPSSATRASRSATTSTAPT